MIALGGASPVSAQSDIWVSAYYAGWLQGYNNTGYLRAEDIDYSAVTHIMHFALVPRSDGTLDDQSNGVTSANAAALIPFVHAAGKKVLITVGGWGSDVAFRGSTNPANLNIFIANLVGLMESRGYDGIDIDWEAVLPSDSLQYTAFITNLRSALDTISPRPLLTAATQWQPSIFAALASKFDQINLMTYDLSGAWSGWVTWHNSPIYDGGYFFPNTSVLVPSADGMVNSSVSSGVPIAKLGIGIDFYGYIWSGGHGTPNDGVTDPRQRWIYPPDVQSNVPYYYIMQNYFHPQNHRFDSDAGASYLSFDSTGFTSDKFISYDDELTCVKKINYARVKGIGGVIIWELGGGYRGDMPVGQRDLLLQSVKQALNKTALPDTVPPVISLLSPAMSSTITDSVTLNAAGSDNTGIVAVQFQYNGANIGSLFTSTPYSFTWDSDLSPNGTGTLAVAAWDAAGNKAVDTISANIFNLHPLPKIFKYHTVWQDNFNRANQRPLIGGKWDTLSNAPGGGTMEIVDNAIQPYDTGGFGTPGSVAWDSLLSKGSGSCVTVSQKGVDNRFSSLLMYARMSSKDFNTGNGYRLRYVDDPSGPDLLAIQLVTNGTVGADIVTTQYEVNVGDTLKFIVQDDSTNTLVAYVNSTQVLSVVDTLFNPASGYVWLISFMLDSIPRFDNFSIISSADPAALRAPSPPALAAPAKGLNGSVLNPTLTWGKSGTAVSYRIQVFTSPSFSSTLVDSSGVAGTSVSLSKLALSTTYYWRLNASNASGTSNWSDIWYFVTTSDSSKLPIQLSSFVADASRGNAVTVDWTTITEVNNYGFYVERRSRGETIFQTVSGLIPGAGTSLEQHEYTWKDTTVTIGSYYYRLKQIDLNGDVAYSNVIVVNVTGVTAVRDIDAPKVFQLFQNYPNPFNPATEIKFTVEKVEHASLTIYNVLGQEVSKLFDGIAEPGRYYRAIFDGSKLSSGIYIYRLVTDSRVAVRKMLLIR
jgi:chitinase